MKWDVVWISFFFFLAEVRGSVQGLSVGARVLLMVMVAWRWGLGLQ